MLTGGKKPEGLGAGFFFSPTLIGNATKEMKVYQAETFSPVIPLFTCASVWPRLRACAHLQTFVT